ncbi:hypothetical protein DNFV4_02305 [Nitrospira tepida]|uniref:Uncharacterized protein n=1 Tax=Nitrospira tepida TaxID=2973512 RepID=A0AA86MZG2_9BACT|nr:hypothetical protein [Nitrospira tepida]CAI4031884.1 hypothetical protein DNFV4_02305 [Nitrospira tepida]
MDVPAQASKPGLLSDLGEDHSIDRPPASNEPLSPAAADSKPFLCRPLVRKTIYVGFGLMFAAMLAWRFYPVLTDPTFEKHVAEKRVAVGMTREQVMQSWGSPYTMRVSYTDDGLRREEWVYEDWIDSATVKHRYLYFEEGVLVGGWYH